MAGPSFIPNAFYIGHGRSEQHVYRSLCSWSFATVVVDDVALFVRSVEEEIHPTMGLLTKFGEATRLLTNMQKSCAIPIRCEQPELERIEQNLPCTLAAFPCTYLGLSILFR